METQAGAVHPVVEKLLDDISRADAFSEKKKHGIDVHFTIPFFFKRFYVVFSSGADRRKKTTAVVNADQRARTLAGDVAWFVAGLLCFSSFLGTILYKILQLELH